MTITCSCAGSRPLDPPAEQSFWLTSVTGPGEQKLVWRPGSDEDLLFVMTADGSSLDADVSVGLRIERLFRLGLIGIAVGPVILIGGVWMTRRGIRRTNGSAHFDPTVSPPDDSGTDVLGLTWDEAPPEEPRED